MKFILTSHDHLTGPILNVVLSRNREIAQCWDVKWLGMGKMNTMGLGKGIDGKSDVALTWRKESLGMGWMDTPTLIEAGNQISLNERALHTS
ncbi:hypothetical protein L1987_02370 [Smallanthus sonchifolius]|uniref:Uncharacterized protein n=1 Tax=Smallanthus sonchifolius TaxID=185202 RepID=A0ACB9K7K0_9ASTR|nr:hypothetical protein L1987_02370 [Smallanthus sonchifolius]